MPRARLAAIIQRIITEKELSQTSAGAIVNEAPSQLSLLMSGRLAGFSTDRLVRMLIKLGRDVEVTVKKTRTAGRTGHVRVTEPAHRGRPGRPPGRRARR